MENPKAYLKYYNLTGKYTDSEKEFQKYLKIELTFYKKLHERVVEGRTGGIKLESQNNFFDLDGFNLIFY